MPQSETLEQVQRAGRDRLYPSITNPSWLVLRKRRDVFTSWLKSVSARDLSVLDVGGRIQPYRILLAEKCARYMAMDVRLTPLVNVVGRAEQLPFGSQQFDIVLCTQVLEYVPEPQVVIAEIHRALKAGGVLLLSVPAVFPRDSGREYWRFLPCALKYLLSAFSSVDVVSEGNSLIGFIRTVNVCLVTFIKPRFFGTVLRFSMVPVLNMLGALLQFVMPSTDDRFTANFSVLARK
jgi:SAM-dependent methyltransferase